MAGRPAAEEKEQAVSLHHKLALCFIAYLHFGVGDLFLGENQEVKLKLRIFVIDDEESIRESLQMYLESLGHEVLTASEPALCNVYLGHLCKSDEACADLLFVDYNMPRMTGVEFLEWTAMKGCKAHPQNIILFSGDTASIDKNRTKLIGCQVIQKPLKFAQVDEIIDEVKKRKSLTNL